MTPITLTLLISNIIIIIAVYFSIRLVYINKEYIQKELEKNNKKNNEIINEINELQSALEQTGIIKDYPSIYNTIKHSYRTIKIVDRFNKLLEYLNVEYKTYPEKTVIRKIKMNENKKG